MKKGFIRIICKVIVVFMLTTLVLSGCGAQENSNQTGTPTAEGTKEVTTTDTATSSEDTSSADELEWKSDTSPFSFRQFFYGTWATMYVWKDQYAMKLATEKTGVTIDRFLATGNDDDYLNTMIAADDLPDSLMLEWNKPTVSKLIKSGMVLSLTDLINQYCPKFNDILDEEMVKYHSVDGELWYLPTMYTTIDGMKNGLPTITVRPWFIRKDIYEALGKPKMETPDDYIAAMKLAKQQYPDISALGLEKFDVNTEGLKGSRSMDWLIYSFAPNLEKERINDQNQTYEYPMRNEGFREAFRFLNRLNREGLFDPNLLIYKQEQYEEKLYGANYFVASQYTSDMYGKFNPKIEATLGNDKTYISLDGLKVNGQDPKYPSSRNMGWQGFFITKNAKNPERIIKFAEYAWSDEGQMDFRYGKEGETYDMKDGLPVLKPEITELRYSDSAGFDAKYGFEESHLLWRSGELWDKAGQITFKEQQPEQYATLMNLSKYNEDIFSLGIDNVEPDGTSSEGVINAKVKDIWNKTIPKLALAKSDAEFDSVYSDFISQIDKVGAEKAEKAMYLRHVDDMKKKSGSGN